MFCPKCGREVPEGYKFCGNCGAAVSADLVTGPPAPAPALVAAPGTAAPVATPNTGPSFGALVLSGLVVLGTLLPWAQAFLVSISGVQSDGVFSLAGGILGVVGGLDGLIAKRPRILAGILVLLGGLLATGMAISVMSRLVGLEGVRLGAGLWLTILAGLGEAAAGLAVLTAAGKQRKSK